MKMRGAVGLVITQRWVWATDKDRKIPTFHPRARTDAVDFQALNGKVAGLKIEEQGFAWLQRPQQRRFADTGFTEDTTLDAALFC
jgi:hypothetical protein